MERKIICKIAVGSHLYGTSGPESDRDYFGVYLPSAEDLLAIDRYPGEIAENRKLSQGLRNEAGDIDCKYFSLGKFIKLAGEGQPGQLELLFAPAASYASAATEEWLTILKSRSDFLAKTAVLPFLGFAEAQAHKATIKGANLKRLRVLIAFGDSLEKKVLGRSLREQLTEREGLPDPAIQIFTNASGAELIEIAGRKFDVATPLKRLFDSLKILERKYGKRSESASEGGADWKSVHHAFRLTMEADDLLREGEIRLPFTGDRLRFLMDLKKGNQAQRDWGKELQERILALNDLYATSPLPVEVDWAKLEALHHSLLLGHLRAIL